MTDIDASDDLVLHPAATGRAFDIGRVIDRMIVDDATAADEAHVKGRQWQASSIDLGLNDRGVDLLEESGDVALRVGRRNDTSLAAHLSGGRSPYSRHALTQRALRKDATPVTAVAQSLDYRS
ncbi:hypothetical protein [Paraburkholderia caballeronis]|uniref:hypothetical protein n=2 Tax=Paraburkholderia caballeronis TaxID=416943 RepID=UPI001066DF7C|nr:hypothetical protein [Paraburkholderia caballeronis]